MRILIVALACVLALTGCGESDSSRDTKGGQKSGSSEPTPSASQKNSASISQPKPGRGTASVVGVRFDDRLNVRRQPDASAPVVTRIAPTGSAELTGKSKNGWREVRTPQGTGWANQRFLGQLAKRVDITAEATKLGIAPTRRALAMKIVRSRADSSEGGSLVVAARGATFVVDALGYPDDAIAGERFVITTTPGEAGFEVTRASATPICVRGVSGGKCA